MAGDESIEWILAAGVEQAVDYTCEVPTYEFDNRSMSNALLPCPRSGALLSSAFAFLVIKYVWTVGTLFYRRLFGTSIKLEVCCR